MNPSKGYYSLIQFCPNPARAEAVNVGVILLCPDKHFIDVKLSPNSKRASKFFGRGTFDADLLRLAKQSVEERIRIEHDELVDVDGFQQLIDTRGNDVLITDPRPVKVRNPGVDLERLFCELVEPMEEAEESHAPLIPRIDQAFHQNDFAGRIRFNQHITIPVLDAEREFPYVYRNGIDNLVLPQRFGIHPRRAKRSASQIGVEGQFLQGHEVDGIGRQLIVVSAHDGSVVEDNAIENEVQRVFDELKVKFVTSRQVEQFIKQVSEEAHCAET
jgi:hypothetical protein